MSQFWQNLQPRLHSAVPKRRTGVPGKKWFRGFFSIGSIQKPVLRPYVSSIIFPFSFCHTKQKPRSPTFKWHTRKQSWLRIRPSDGAVHQRPGKSPFGVSTITIGRAELTISDSLECELKNDLTYAIFSAAPPSIDLGLNLPAMSCPETVKNQ